MNKLLLLFFTSVFLMLTGNLSAQETEQIPMADQLYSSGKIYVVLGVILIIFLGIVLYLISLDRKITKLEKETGLKK